MYGSKTTSLIYSSHFSEYATATNQQNQSQNPNNSQFSLKPGVVPTTSADINFEGYLVREENITFFNAVVSALRRKEFVTLCLIAFIASFGAMSFELWSVLYFKNVLQASNINESLGYSTFHVCLAIVRLGSDSVRVRMGHKLIVTLAGVSCLLGMLLILTAGSVAFAPNNTLIPGAIYMADAFPATT